MSQGDEPDGRRYHHGNLRAALVEAGLELTRHGGPAALGLREVTRRVGVSPNAAYRHFDGRAALVEAVASRIRALMAERMLAAGALVTGTRSQSPDGSDASDSSENPASSQTSDDSGPSDGSGTPASSQTPHDPATAGATEADQARARLRAVGLGYIDFAVSERGWFAVAFFPPGETSAAGPAPTESPEPAAHPYSLLTEALDDLVAAGTLAPEARDGAQWPCWSAVHGFAELANQGPLRDLPVAQVRQFAERTVDAVIAGICD